MAIASCFCAQSSLVSTSGSRDCSFSSERLSMSCSCSSASWTGYDPCPAGSSPTIARSSSSELRLGCWLRRRRINPRPPPNASPSFSSLRPLRKCVVLDRRIAEGDGAGEPESGATCHARRSPWTSSMPWSSLAATSVGSPAALASTRAAERAGHTGGGGFSALAVVAPASRTC